MLPSRSPQEARAAAARVGLTILTADEEFAQRLAEDEATIERLRGFRTDAPSPRSGSSTGQSPSVVSSGPEVRPLRWRGRRSAPVTPPTNRAHEGSTWITLDDDPRTVPGGPLTGWEVGVKDLIAVEELMLTAGTRAHRGRRALRDAPAVGRLRAAGATIRGTTNLHALAYGATGTSSDWGVPENPSVQGAIPGGSSSGSASAVAEGTAALTLGTDTSGSIRIPAALCGVAGLKPTRGLISLEGSHPLSPRLDHVGPLAPSVGALAAAMSVLAGWDDLSLPAEPDGRIRLGVLGGYFTTGVAPTVRAAFDSACQRLSDLGVELTPVELPLIDHIPGAQLALLGTEALRSNLPTLRARGRELPADVRLRLEAGLARTEEQYALSLALADSFGESVSSALRRCHALISPTTAITAPPRGTTHVDIDGEQVTVQFSLTRLTMPFNFSGHPALTIPLHEATTDPVGLQLVGGAGEDRALLALAAHLEDALA